jgi:hypothetical protein
MLLRKYDGKRLSPRSMWDFSIMISFLEGAGITALGSTRHLEISLAAISPSCSIEDKTSSSKLHVSQLPPEASGIADSISAEDYVEVAVPWDVVAWCVKVSRSMAARGVADMTSKNSTNEDGEARL